MVDPVRRGALLVVEGIDGAGKTTQVGLLAKLLERVGERVVLSKEPTDSAWGRKIRASAIHGRMGLEDELEAFVEDRRLHVEHVIGPAVASGAIVLLDRYYLSTIAYQGSRGGDVEGIRARMDEFPAPALAIVLDLEVREGLRRVAARDGTPNYFEREDELAKARAIFRALGGDRTVLIDGARTIEAIHAEVRDCVFAHGGPLYEIRCAKSEGCEDIDACIHRQAGTCEWFNLRERLPGP